MTSRTFSRRSLVRLVGLGAAATALAACSSPPSPTAAPAGAQSAGAKPPAEAAKPTAATPAAQAPAKGGAAVTLEFTSWTADNGAWQKVADNYMARTPGVTLKVTPVPGGNEYYQKLQTAIAGGAKPDLASFQGWEWQTYADKGVLAEIDGYITNDKFTGAWPDIETVKIHTQWKGKRYLVPMQMASMLMLYSRKAFQEKGVTPPTDDWTFEEFLDMARKLTDTSGPTKKFGLQANGNWVRDIHWLRGSGKDEFDALVEPKKAQFNQPEIVDMVQIVASDVFNKLKIAPTPADMQGGANTIEAGAAAMKYEGPWYFPTLTDPKLKEQKKDVPFDAVLMPKTKDSRRRHRGWSEGVNLLKGDKIDAAWAFARYMADEDGQKVYSELSGRIPNNPQLAEKFWIPIARERYGVENAKAYLKAFELSMPDVISPVPRSKIEAEAVKPEGWDPLVAGTAQAKDVLPKVDAKVQALLDAANKK